MVDNQPKYVPIIKWKSGEKEALRSIGKRERKNIRPLIELVSDEGDTPEKLSLDIKKYWPDTAYLDVSQRPIPFAEAALRNLAEYSTEGGIDLIPVIEIDTHFILHEPLRNVAFAFNNGIAIRLHIENDTDVELKSRELMLLVETLKIPAAKIDLIIDFGFIAPNLAYERLMKLLAKEISMDQWREVIIAAGVFPQDLTDFKPNEDNFLNRWEWIYWNKYHKLLGRNSIFADYTCRHPVYYSMKISGSKSLRYTLDTKFQILRGTKQDPPFKSLVHALNAVTLYDDEYPASFSSGDTFMHEKAELLKNVLIQGEDPEKADLPPGGPKDWVAASVNHHIAVVLKQNLRV